MSIKRPIPVLISGRKAITSYVESHDLGFRPHI